MSRLSLACDFCIWRPRLAVVAYVMSQKLHMTAGRDERARGAMMNCVERWGLDGMPCDEELQGEVKQLSLRRGDRAVGGVRGRR